MRKKLLILILLGLMSVCSLPSSLGQRLFPGNPTATTMPNAAIRAQLTFAQDLDVPGSSVSIVRVESKQWQDTCLEAPIDNESCVPAEIDGYQVIVAVNDFQVEYRTDQNGIMLRQAKVISASPIALQARQLLGGFLGIDPETILILNEKSVSFPNSCLNMQIDEITCAPLPTDGHLVILQALGIKFEFRSNNNNNQLFLASAGSMLTTQPVITWSKQGGQFNSCEYLKIYINGTYIKYFCRDAANQEPGIFQLSPTQQKQLLTWMITYQGADIQQVDSDNASVHLTLYGIGLNPLEQTLHDKFLDFVDELTKP